MRALALVTLVVTIGCSHSNGGGGGGGGASSPGTYDESLPGAAPTLNAVFTIDGTIAYAVGDSDSVWRRDGGGWAAVSPPVGYATAKLDGVWAAADDDVYVTTALGGTTVLHSSDRGHSWTRLPSMSTNPVSIAGTDATHVYVAGFEGDIAVGSATGPWTIDRTADNVQWVQIANGRGTMLAVNDNSAWVLDTTWTKLFDLGSSGGVLWGTWGTSRDDVYAVGTNSSCGATVVCGTIYHSVRGGFPTLQKVAQAFMAIYGSTSGKIYAVGSGGTVATSSGNDSWSVTMPVSSLLTAVHGANGHVYAVGMSGTILHIVE